MAPIEAVARDATTVSGTFGISDTTRSPFCNAHRPQSRRERRDLPIKLRVGHAHPRTKLRLGNYGDMVVTARQRVLGVVQLRAGEPNGTGHFSRSQHLFVGRPGTHFKEVPDGPPKPFEIVTDHRHSSSYVAKSCPRVSLSQPMKRVMFAFAMISGVGSQSSRPCRFDWSSVMSELLSISPSVGATLVVALSSSPRVPTTDSLTSRASLFANLQRRGNPCGCPVFVPQGTHKGHSYFRTFFDRPYSLISNVGATLVVALFALPYPQGTHKGHPYFRTFFDRPYSLTSNVGTTLVVALFALPSPRVPTRDTLTSGSSSDRPYSLTSSVGATLVVALFFVPKGSHKGHSLTSGPSSTVPIR